MKPLILSLSIALLFSFHNNAQQKTVKKTNKSKIEQGLMTAKPVEVPLQNGIAKAYFASGCFWCVEAVYESVKGWNKDLTGMRDMKDAPQEFLDYITYLERELQTPITIVSVGPDREQTIIRK